MQQPLILPWDCLAHDNHRLLPRAIRTRAGTIVGRQVTAPVYRAAKQAVESLCLASWTAPRLLGPVQVHGRAFFPDARKRDAGNYRKLITDALSGIAYDDDSQIVREIWEKAGIDRVHPRLELTVSAA